MDFRKCMLRMAIMCGLPGIMLAVTDPIWFGIAMLVIGVSVLSLGYLRIEEG